MRMRCREFYFASFAFGTPARQATGGTADKAVDDKDREAARLVGWMWLTGHPYGKKDYPEAYKAFRLAALQGHVRAYYDRAAAEQRLGKGEEAIGSLTRLAEM